MLKTLGALCGRRWCVPKTAPEASPRVRFVVPPCVRRPLRSSARGGRSTVGAVAGRSSSLRSAPALSPPHPPSPLLAPTSLPCVLRPSSSYVVVVAPPPAVLGTPRPVATLRGFVLLSHVLPSVCLALALRFRFGLGGRLRRRLRR